MTTLQEKIEIMQAFANGEKIEFKNDEYPMWVACDPNGPEWNWRYSEYRIVKPEPKKIRLLAWLDLEDGYLNFRTESFGEPKHAASVRVPSEDKEIELP